MELRQLRYAVEVHRQGSFTAAAEALHVSQSGVSAQVAKLERELGVRLFERGSRVATLTPDGDALLAPARAALQSVTLVRTIADELTGVARGHVRVGTVIGCTIPGYLDAFAAYRRAHPGVSVSAVEGNSADLVAALLAGELDVALVAHAAPLPAALTVTTIVDEPVAVGVAVGHPWERRATVSAGALAGEDVVTLPPGTGVRAALDTTCGAVGVAIAPAVQVHSPVAALALAAQGVGVAVLTESMIAGHLGTIAIRRAAHTSLSLVSRAEPGAAARAFVELLRARLANDVALVSP